MKTKRIFEAATVLTVAILLYFNSCERDKRFEQYRTRTERNVAALNSQLKTEKLKNGAYATTNKSLEVSLNELKSYNSKLYDDVKSQKRATVAIRAAYELQLANLKANTSVIKVLPDSTFATTWHTSYKDSTVTLSLTGSHLFGFRDSKPFSETEIKDLSVSIALSCGVKKNPNGSYDVFAITKSDKVEVTRLESAVIHIQKETVEKKKKRWGIGPNLSISASKFGVAPSVGFGIHYSIIAF